ncbi:MULTISPECIES: hypothetical protein [unclassified Lysinibacillus]|uniref:hypothetical protein n=1 Tax=unclassified Lysinibacillus TaxID=2636778 RepID=UPI001F0AAA41|nr:MULTISPECIES: hypothetical protein [unclassified Lysinibacillus]
MIETTIPQIIWGVFTATGMVAIGAGVIGYWYRKMLWFERIIAIAAGLLLIYSEKFSDWAGLAIFIAMFVIQYVTQHKGNGDDNQNGKTSVTA